MVEVMGNAAQGNIDLRQSVTGRDKDEQIITVKADEIPEIVAKLMAAAVCVGRGYDFPPVAAKAVSVN